MNRLHLGLASCIVVVACGGSGSSTGLPSSGSSSGSGGGSGDDSGSQSSSGSGSGSSSGSSSGSGGSSSGSSGSGSSSGGNSSGSSGSGSSSGSSSSSGGGGTSPPAALLPTVKGTCPTLATGNVTFSGQTWQLWAGTPTASQHGPLLIYWHYTGGNSNEPTLMFGQAQINAITSAGGLVASPQATTGMGTNTGNGVWYTGDFDTADQVVACAIAQLHIDTRQIFVSGASAGGLQTSWMSYARSGYLAAAVSISGGIIVAPMRQDSHVPPAMAIHGAMGSDVVGIDFAMASANWEMSIKTAGGFSIDCNTGGGHVSGPPAISPSIWQFMKDHPFGVKPDPYATAIPSSFPSYCKID